MISIKSDFNEKISESKELLSHIEKLSESSGYTKITPILKSTFILLLYNMIESTMTLVLEKIHEKASQNSYNELSDKLKIIFISYYLTNQKDKIQKQYLERIMLGNLKFPLFSDYTKKINIFSGNLDSREINKIVKQYGLGEIETENKDKLLIIKNKRNKIAHGENMFKESCRNFTIQELYEMQKATIGFFNQLLTDTEYYLQQKRFKLNG